MILCCAGSRTSRCSVARAAGANNSIVCTGCSPTTHPTTAAEYSPTGSGSRHAACAVATICQTTWGSRPAVHAPTETTAPVATATATTSTRGSKIRWTLNFYFSLHDILYYYNIAMFYLFFLSFDNNNIICARASFIV